MHDNDEFVDIERICIDCNNRFVTTTEKQRYLEERG